MLSPPVLGPGACIQVGGQAHNSKSQLSHRQEAFVGRFGSEVLGGRELFLTLRSLHLPPGAQ